MAQKELAPLISDLKEKIEFAKAGIVSKTIFESPKVKYVLFCLEKGQKLSKHTAPFSAAIYVIEGKGDFLLGDKTYPGKAGSFYLMPSELTHAIKAKENLVFLLVMVR